MFHFKDRVAYLDRSSIIYKINCIDCDASYIGLTDRRFKTRILEHKTGKPSPTSFTKHLRKN